jgi:iron complex outermembrane recepter protein
LRWADGNFQDCRLQKAAGSELEGTEFMRNFRNLALASVSVIASVGAMTMAMPAFAQATAAADEETDNSDIVVTGTLIRGTAAVGSQTLSVTAEAISAKAAGSTNELLGLIPQISNTFNGRFETDPRGIGANISINRPNLRNAPGLTSASGGLTLVMMDGMRMTPVGVQQSAIDVDMIPTAVLAGVDVVPDGGSSLYGADAVAGVINFRTLKTFDGIKLDGNFGFGSTIKGYRQWDGSATVGHSWAAGNAYISVSHAERDSITNGQAPWFSPFTYSATGVASLTGTQCNSAVGTQVRYFQFAPGSWTNNPAAPGAGVFPVGSPCDTTSAGTYSPQQKRTNVFASVSHEISDKIDLRIVGYWAKRDTTLPVYSRGFTTAAQTFVPPAAGLFPVGSIQSVLGGTSFSLAPNTAYVNTPQRVGFETWGITPEVTVKLGSGNWQVRNTLHFGRSTNYQSFPGVDSIKAQAYVTAGQLNPVNVAAASAAVIADITNFDSAQQTKQQLFMIRSIVDGPIFALPGGDAKIAAGIEYQQNTADSRLNGGAALGVINTLPYRHFSRNSKSLFAEVTLPVQSFMDVTGSVRYDHYSDFGSTTNPNLGFTIRAASWLKLYGHWGTTFNAPTAIDGLGISAARVAPNQYSAARSPTDPFGKFVFSGTNTDAVILEGSTAGVKPQTSHSFALGFEARPFEGFRVGANFYRIDIKGLLGAVDPSNLNTYRTNPDAYIYLNGNSALYDTILSTVTNGAAFKLQVPANKVGLLVDRRTSNIGNAELQGIDFNLGYEFDSSIGRLGFGVSGTRGTRALVTVSGITADNLAVGGPRFTATNFATWSKGGMSARVTVNYSGEFKDSGTNNLGVAGELVKAFIVTNLSLGYTFDESAGVIGGTSLRFNVDNLFNTQPQTILRPANSSNPSYNNWTLGRVIKLGFGKKF